MVQFDQLLGNDSQHFWIPACAGMTGMVRRVHRNDNEVVFYKKEYSRF